MVERYIAILFMHAGMVISGTIHLMINLKAESIWKCISLYNQCTIIISQFNPVLVTSNVFGNSVAFTVIVCSANAVLWGFIYDSNFFKIVGSIFLIFICFVLNSMFNTSCRIFEDCTVLVRKWRITARERKDGGYMRRVVRSLIVLGVPTGVGGISDTEFKINFLSRAVDYVINVHLAVKNVFLQ